MHGRRFSVWLLIAALVAACGPLQRVEPSPIEPDKPGFFTWKTQARLYPNATRVLLVVDNNEFDEAFRLVSHPETRRWLSAGERREFDRALYRVRVLAAPKGENYPIQPACFIPHHFFRYFDDAGKQVGEVAVCFCCFQAKANPAMPNENLRDEWLSVHLGKVEALLTRMGVRTQQQCEAHDA